MAITPVSQSASSAARAQARLLRVGLILPVMVGPSLGAQLGWREHLALARAAEARGLRLALDPRRAPLRVRRRAAGRLVGMLDDAGGRGRRDDRGGAGDIRDLHQLPQPGPGGEDGRHGGRDQRRSAGARPGRRLVGAAVPHLRLSRGPPARPVRRGAGRHPRAAARRPGHPRGSLLPGTGRRTPPGWTSPRRHPDHARWWERADDAPGGPVRGGLERVPHRR